MYKYVQNSALSKINNKLAKRKSTYTDRYRYMQPGDVKH